MIGHALIAIGFTASLTAFFPLSVSAWLPRSSQLTDGLLILLFGLLLVEMKALGKERER